MLPELRFSGLKDKEIKSTSLSSFSELKGDEIRYCCQSSIYKPSYLNITPPKYHITRKSSILFLHAFLYQICY